MAARTKKEKALHISTLTLEDVTPKYDNVLAEVREDWYKAGVATGPIDREKAYGIVEDCYKAVDLACPPRDRFFFMPSTWAAWEKATQLLKAEGAGNQSIDWCWGHHDYWLAAYDFLLRVGVEGLDSVKALVRTKDLGWWIPFDTAVVLADRPEEVHYIKGTNGLQLHKDGGPAIRFSDDTGVWALNGVLVSPEIAETPAEQLDPNLLVEEQNMEVRREIVRKIGIERICAKLGCEVLDKTGDYELILLAVPGQPKRPFLKMVNPSIGVYHVEGVSPNIRSVRAAILERNGLKEEQIDDVNGSDYYQQGDVLLFPEGATKFKFKPKKLT